MTRTATLIFLIALLVGLSAVPNAVAIGVEGQQVVARSHRAPAVSRTSQPSTVDRTPKPASLLAPRSTCPGQNNLNAPLEAQEQAMHCLTDFARRQFGLSPLSGSEELEMSADHKLGDVLSCDSFSHFACGRPFSHWMRETGYTSAPCWHVGENLAWGAGEFGTVRSIFQAWMRSTGHRANILGDYSEVGLSVGVGTLEGRRNAYVWVQHFGRQCAAPDQAATE